MSRLLAWLLGPPAEKHGGQITPRNAPVPQVSRQVPEPPVPGSRGRTVPPGSRLIDPPAACESLGRHPVTVMHVDLYGAEFERAVERAVGRIARRRGNMRPHRR